MLEAAWLCNRPSPDQLLLAGQLKILSSRFLEICLGVKDVEGELKPQLLHSEAMDKHPDWCDCVQIKCRLQRQDLRADLVRWLDINSWVAGGKARVTVEGKQILSLLQETIGKT